MIFSFLQLNVPKNVSTAETAVFPYQEQRARWVHVRPGRRRRDEIRTGGGESTGGAHEWHLVLSGRPREKQGNAEVISTLAASEKWPSHFRTGRLIDGSRACVCCSSSQPWVFRSWATLSPDPRPFCGQRAVSPSRRGPPRLKASSTVLRSRAWCWMLKVRNQVCYGSGPQTPDSGPVPVCGSIGTGGADRPKNNEWFPLYLLSESEQSFISRNDRIQKAIHCWWRIDLALH